MWMFPVLLMTSTTSTEISPNMMVSKIQIRLLVKYLIFTFLYLDSVLYVWIGRYMNLCKGFFFVICREMKSCNFHSTRRWLFTHFFLLLLRFSHRTLLITSNDANCVTFMLFNQYNYLQKWFPIIRRNMCLQHRIQIAISKASFVIITLRKNRSLWADRPTLLQLCQMSVWVFFSRTKTVNFIRMNLIEFGVYMYPS